MIMKNVILGCLLLCGVFNANAQLAEKSYLGSGIVYGSDVSGFGIGALGEFFLNE